MADEDKQQPKPKQMVEVSRRQRVGEDGSTYWEVERAYKDELEKKEEQE